VNPDAADLLISRPGVSAESVKVVNDRHVRLPSAPMATRRSATPAFPRSVSVPVESFHA